MAEVSSSLTCRKLGFSTWAPLPSEEKSSTYSSPEDFSDVAWSLCFLLGLWLYFVLGDSSLGFYIVLSGDAFDAGCDWILGASRRLLGERLPVWGMLSMLIIIGWVGAYGAPRCWGFFSGSGGLRRSKGVEPAVICLVIYWLSFLISESKIFGAAFAKVCDFCSLNVEYRFEVDGNPPRGLGGSPTSFWYSALYS